MKAKEEQIKQVFKDLSESDKPKPHLLKNCIFAFIVGGIICVIAQGIMNFLEYLKFSTEDTLSITPMVMVFLGALLTGIGIYDKIATFGGAGTVVPITGFSNAIVSPAIEFKKEGYVFGVASKMFTIAGPVLVYGISASVIVGIIYYFIGG